MALAKYLGKKAYCVWQPIPVNKPAWYYFLLKFRDIWLVLTKHRPAEVFIGVESINALLGKLLGYKKVIYWNLDYSPNRGWVWGLFDYLAICLSDEVWTLSNRGVGKVVPIGYWKLYKSRKRDPLGVVYVGLLQDGQGVEGLIWFGITRRDVNITIIGSGKDEKKYREMAKDYPNIKFTGILSDEEVRKIMLKNKFGWLYFHPLNKNHKIIPSTKPLTYFSCGLVQLTNDHPTNCYRWKDIFKYALNSHTHN